MTDSTAHAAFVYAGAFVDELARSGLQHVCVAPGSRSTPLALAMARHPALRVWMHLDERSAGFFALGMARALDAPVAVLCTSGTAAANFLPAVVEAFHAGVPLLVLTADRPPELRGVSAAQTIDQHGLYGAHTRWFVDMALPEARPALLAYVRTVACRAIATATASPRGPVHLNFPFREPLVPAATDLPGGMSGADSLAWHGRPDGGPWVSVTAPQIAPPAATVHQLASEITHARRPLIVCGPQYDPCLAAPLAAVARAAGAPLLADPLSQLRWGAHDRTVVMDRYDAMLRDAGMAGALVPDLVIRLGAPPTSKPLLQYLELHAAARQIVVAPAGWPDPLLGVAAMIRSDARLLCERLADALAAEHSAPGHARPEQGEEAWLARWRHADDVAAAAMASYLSGIAEPFDGRALADVADVLPSGSTLFVSSSMPVRDLDAFAAGSPRAIRVLGNRGANGIDGVVSSALGAATACMAVGAPLVLVIGDLAFYHDMNGLLAARLHGLDATIVVLNNDGGGIFSFLPQAASTEHFEQLFGTPHGLDFAPAAALYGATYQRAGNSAALREAVRRGVTGSGLHVVEVRTDRARNVTLHREAWSAVAAALRHARSQ